MKILISILMIFNVCAGVGSGGNSLIDSGRVSEISEVQEVLGVGSGGNSLSLADIIEVEGAGGGGGSLKLSYPGEYDFDSSSNRWFLKTKSRLLSVKRIELIDKFENKQLEVRDVSFNVKKARKNLSENILKRRILRKVKFKDYKIDDFSY